MANIKNEFWYTDREGRRIGWLWPEDMATILEGFYGQRRWVKGFIKDFGYSRSQVDRWKDGRNPIPKDVAQIINMLGTMRVRGIPLSPIQVNHPAGCGCAACVEQAGPTDDEIAMDARELRILTGGDDRLIDVGGDRGISLAQARRNNPRYT